MTRALPRKSGGRPKLIAVPRIGLQGRKGRVERCGRASRWLLQEEGWIALGLIRQVEARKIKRPEGYPRA